MDTVYPIVSNGNVSNNISGASDIDTVINIIDIMSILCGVSSILYDIESQSTIYKTKKLIFLDEVTEKDKQRESSNPYWSFIPEEAYIKTKLAIETYLSTQGSYDDESENHMLVMDYPIIIHKHKLFITQKTIQLNIRGNNPKRLLLLVIYPSSKNSISSGILTSSLKAYRFDFKENKYIECFPDKLSKTERKILQRVRMGMSNQEIADSLYISTNTVKTHKSKIIKKLQVNSIIDALAIVNSYYLL